MCIAASVGRDSRNSRDDVRTLKLMLNLNHASEAQPLTPDSRCDAETIATIERYQFDIVGGTDRRGTVAASGSTLAALRKGLPPGLSEEKLCGIFINATPAQVRRFYPALAAAMQAAAIDTPLRQAHFLAQVGHESGELRYTEELASGVAYEGRKDLGNTSEGDGIRFKGRGLIQLTGRLNYAAFGKHIGRDLCQDGEAGRVATEVDLCVGTATWFWTGRRLNGPADRDDLTTITRVINGGLNGLADRERLLARARWFLVPAQLSVQPTATQPTAAQPVATQPIPA